MKGHIRVHRRVAEDAEKTGIKQDRLGSQELKIAIFADPVNPVNPEPLAELNKTVTPVTSAVQWTLKNLDSGLRRNDVEGLLQEALMI